MIIRFTKRQLGEYMGQCFDLALQAKRDHRLLPPYVGSILVSARGELISSGYKRMSTDGKKTVHAEFDAIRNGQGSIDDQTTLFTTLEPCRKRRKAPSCSRTIVDARIGRIVYGNVDRSFSHAPYVGVSFLSRQGIEVVSYDELSDRIARELMCERYQRWYFK